MPKITALVLGVLTRNVADFGEYNLKILFQINIWTGM